MNCVAIVLVEINNATTNIPYKSFTQPVHILCVYFHFATMRGVVAVGFASR